MSFAIDIGKFSIKIVELEKVNDTIKIVKLGSINIVDDLIATGGTSRFIIKTRN